ncbi:sulfatase-like hydrolase/transferase, partial [Haloferula sp. A504]|uniref:sulfatase-like hydrolase/transferase n=1 Tax=Haloferula sp. A504 TaxID=3373601 RepID=UPI0031C531E3|nr:sulfatase-like hydrolase/transferase [Verrucomicrobiaceae bacterium E54]
RASNGQDGVITVTTGTSASPTYTLSNSGTVLDFSVTSDASGVIVFDFSRSNNSLAGSISATFNAMSITPPSGPQATIHSFTASPEQFTEGTDVTLSWDVSDADSVSINQGIGAVAASGSLVVRPSDTTTWTLTATRGGNQVTAQATATNTSLGEIHVYLLGGQSNMQGIARSSKLPPELLSIPEIRLYAAGTAVSSNIANQWVTLRPPGSNGNEFGPEIGIGERLRDLRPGTPIALIKYADGGTSLELGWKPGANAADTANWGPQFTGFVNTVSNGLAALEAEGWQPVIHGMCWQQGEQDAKDGLNVAESSTSADDYGANLAHFVSRIREQFAPYAAPEGIRFVPGQVLPYAPDGGDVQARFPGRDLVRQAILDADEGSGATHSIPNTQSVPTNSVGYPTHAQEVDGHRDTDEVHLNATAQLKLGRSMANALLGLGQRPNIVIFLVDDMGVHDTSVPFLLDGADQPVSYNFNNFYQTPNMETLAATGMRFTTAYAQTVCSPTRCGLLTGRTSARHGVTDWVGANDPGSPTNWRISGLPTSEATLPRQLQSIGYRTIHCGKAHFGNSSKNVLDYGFDVNIAGNEKGQPARYIGAGGYGVPGLDAYDSSSVYLTKALTLEASSAIQNAVNEGQPFFLNMSFYAVHTPFTTNPDATGDYSGAVGGSGGNHAKFATMIEGMDIAVGEIRQKLIDLGVAEDTLIIFLGDNGSDSPATTQDGLPSAPFNDWPMRGKKASKWEGGARVPFIATWAVPDAGNPLQQTLPIPANSIETDIVTTWDIPATLLDLAGLPAPADFGEDSHSLLLYLSGTPGTHRPQEIVVHYPHEHRSDFFSWIRQDDLKLIYNFENNTHELYNLATDPTESTNLAASQPETAMALARRLAQKLDAEWGPAGILLPTISSIAPAGNVVSIPNNSGIDLDSDGIDDRDEDPNLNGLVDAGETNPDNDNSDGDNATDGEEAQLGTEPLDPNSFFFLRGVPQLDGSINLIWPSQPGASFEIRSSPDLSDWSTVVDPDVPAANPGNMTTYMVPATASPRKFYRIVLK